MKFWNEFQVFFVYDTKQCLREEDDPKDAIIYFHPPDTADNIRCGLCCQLMGMAQFCSTVFSNATFIHLQRNKFALKNLGRYILALGGNLSMPDNVLKRQLNSLYEIFEFYHKSIEEVERLMPASTELTFHDKMSEIWKCYLPVSQHFGNTLSLTFGILPSLDLPKSGGCIFMKASQILQLCQSKSEVYSGCILTNNQVLCSQMSPSIVRHIYFISSTKPQMPANYITTPLPAGVTIFYVYVKKNLLQDEMEKNDLYKGSHFAQSATIEKEERDKTSCNNSDTLSCKEEEATSCLSESESLIEHNNIHENHCTDTEHSNGFDEKLDQTQTTEDEIIKACLYIQGHSNTQLILLTSEVVAHNMKIIDFLEKSKDYCYLQFDHTLKCIKIPENAGKICQATTASFNGLNIGKASPNPKIIEDKKNEQGKRGNKKLLTDYYPIRRTVRKCQSSVAKEKKKEIEDAIRSGKEEGLKAAVFIGKGRGVVTTRPFQRGDFVVEYSGELVDLEEAKIREQMYAVDENVGCYMYYFRHRNKQYCVDATAETNRLGRLINHSRQGNLITKTFVVDEVPRLILIASRDIKSGEELLYDYGDRRKISILSNPWLAT